MEIARIDNFCLFLLQKPSMQLKKKEELLILFITKRYRLTRHNKDQKQFFAILFLKHEATAVAPVGSRILFGSGIWIAAINFTTTQLNGQQIGSKKSEENILAA